MAARYDNIPRANSQRNSTLLIRLSEMSDSKTMRPTYTEAEESNGVGILSTPPGSVLASSSPRQVGPAFSYSACTYGHVTDSFRSAAG